MEKLLFNGCKSESRTAKRKGGFSKARGCMNLIFSLRMAVEKT